MSLTPFNESALQPEASRLSNGTHTSPSCLTSPPARIDIDGCAAKVPDCPRVPRDLAGRRPQRCRHGAGLRYPRPDPSGQGRLTGLAGTTGQWATGLEISALITGPGRAAAGAWRPAAWADGAGPTTSPVRHRGRKPLCRQPAHS